MLPHFESYDSYLISIVLNGKYSTDNFLMYISPILSYFSKLVNSLVPELNVFLWVCVISTILSLFGLLYCVFFFIENSSIAFSINAFITSVFIPLMILAVPILDTLFAIIRRLLKRQSISTADKEHLHHQLLNMNFSHRTTVLIIYGINILFATASILYTLNDKRDVFIGRIIYAILLVAVIWFVCKTNIITDKKIIFKNKKIKK